MKKLVDDKGLEEYDIVKEAYNKAIALLTQENPNRQELSDLLDVLDKNPKGVEWLRDEEGEAYAKFQNQSLSCIPKAYVVNRYIHAGIDSGTSTSIAFPNMKKALYFDFFHLPRSISVTDKRDLDYSKADNGRYEFKDNEGDSITITRLSPHFSLIASRYMDALFAKQGIGLDEKKTLEDQLLTCIKNRLYQE